MNNTQDEFKSLKEIKENYKNIDDYIIVSKDEVSPISVIAIHGGGIENGTDLMAQMLAEMLGSSLYYFKANKKVFDDYDPENIKLHITSSKYYDVKLIELISKTGITISFHGADEKEPLSYVGGLDMLLGGIIKDNLRKSGYVVPDEIRQGLEGYSIHNICNKNKRKQGIQLEVSDGQMEQFFGADWKYKVELPITSNLVYYLQTLKKSINEYLRFLL